MNSTTMRELQHHTAKVVGWAEAGEEVELTRRGKPVARLAPPRRKGKAKRPDFAERLKTIYGDKVLDVTATALLEEARGDR